MTGNVGKLNIVVGAVSSPLKAGLNTAASTVSGFASKATAGLGSLAAGVGVGLSLMGLKSWVGGAMDTIRTTGLMARRLGISTEELTKLDFAAHKSGVSTEALGAGLGKMERSLGQAAAHGGPVAKTLESLGLNVKDLVALSPDEAFLQISDAVKGMEDPFARAAAITQIFGRGGLELAPLLLRGSDAIREYGRHAKELGLTFGDKDVKSIYDATMGWKTLKAMVSGMGVQFAIALAPTLKWATEGLPAMFTAARNFFGGIRDEVGFFVGTWSLQWELIKVNSLIVWDNLKAAAIGGFDAIVAGLPIVGRNFLAFFENVPKIAVASWESVKAGAVALYENIGGIFQDMGATVMAFGTGVVAALTAAFNLENPLTAFRDAFAKTFSESSSGAFAAIGEVSSKAFSDSLAAQGGLKDMESVSGAMGDAFSTGFKGAIDPTLDAERNKILGQIGDAREEFDKMQAGTPSAIAGAAGAATEAGAAATVAAVGGKLAGATQVGTTEAASQIFASMSAKAGKDDSIAKNTADTASNTARMADAIENLQMPDFDVVEAF